MTVFVPFTITARCLACCAWILLAMCCLTGIAYGQQASVVGNSYVNATVVTDAASSYGGGRFTIDAGPAFNSYRFLYYITSNVVFRITAPGGPYYYTNAQPLFGGEPLHDSVPVPYVPFDQISTTGDTVAVTWNNLKGYSVTMRLFPEVPRNAFVKGSDMLIEFSYRHDGIGVGTNLGIFMMLDVYNGQAGGSGGAGDKSSILTSSGYFPVTGAGARFGAGTGTDSIPRFYHVGDFQYDVPLNTVLPVHRLTGTSHNGASLTTPDLFALGSWRQFRYLSWDVAQSDVASPVGDAATIVRWDTRGSRQGTIRTAFGMDDHDGNNLYHCRDNGLFADIQTERVIARPDSTRPNTATFDAKLWLTNTSETVDTLSVVLIPPGGSTSYVKLAPNAVASKPLVLRPHETQLVTWPLEAKVANKDTMDFPLDLRYTIGSGTQARSFKLQCVPVISLVGPQGTNDRFSPVIVVSGGQNNPGLRLLTIVDQHPGFSYDTGIDSIWVDPVLSYNMVFTRFGTPVHCQTDTVHGAVRAADSSQPGRLVIGIRDCAGNTTLDTVLYKVADRVPPVANVVRLSGTPTQEWTITMADQHPNFQYDSGIDSIWADVASQQNITYSITTAFVRCDPTSSAVLSVRVVDGPVSGFIKFYIRDCAGNLDSVLVVYTPSAGVDIRNGAVAGDALAIRDVHPQPLRAGANGALEFTVANVPARGAVAELISADGRVVVRTTLEGNAGPSAARSIPVPGSLASGVYILRVSGANGMDSRKVLITR